MSLPLLLLKKIVWVFRMTLFSAVRVSLYWNKALDAASQGNHAQALKNIVEIEKITPTLTSAQVLKVFLLFSTKNYEACIDTAKKAFDLIKGSRKYTGEEKKYLLYYVSIWGNSAAALLGCGDEISLAIKIEDIKLDRVRRHLKRKFLLRDHPDWVDV